MKISLLIGLFLLTSTIFSVAQATADHSKFKELNKNFQTGPQVTKACLKCHNKAAEHIMKTSHWNWETVMPDGKKMGKKTGVFNNFCVMMPGNEARCTSCHIGYGWKDTTFHDVADASQIDCLVCHDTTGEYKKFPSDAGHPAYKDKKFGGKLWKKVNLKNVAQNIGKPTRANCLACHANGGGGNGVKHGDTDTSLVNPNMELDVHMNHQGLNMSCQDCHTTKEHNIAGRYYNKAAYENLDQKLRGKEKHLGKTISCQGCHGQVPHESARLNNHSKKVSCEACHIPLYARGGIPTKLSWDWSTAGKFDKDGKHLKLKDDNGYVKYMTKKGSFVYGENVVPEYRWYKGELKQLTVFDKIDDTKVVDVNPPTGDYDDKLARIWPFKIHTGKQPYDTINKVMLPIKLFGKKASGAYWKNFDWKLAIEKGSEYNGVEFSGEFDFIETNGYWPIKHMVAPKENAVSCQECHKSNGRLEQLKDFYLPGRDGNKWIDILGLLMILGSIGAAFGHGLLRYLTSKKK